MVSKIKKLWYTRGKGKFSENFMGSKGRNWTNNIFDSDREGWRLIALSENKMALW